MRRVNMHEAKSTLSALVAAVESGAEQEIVLTRNGKPAARIIPLDPADTRPVLGLAEGRYRLPSDESWAEMDREIEAMFLDGDDDHLPRAAE